MCYGAPGGISTWTVANGESETPDGRIGSTRTGVGTGATAWSVEMRVGCGGTGAGVP
jgi:hypothetical protein